MDNFNPSKPCTTRSGLKVVIYCTDAPGDYPIHGRIESFQQPMQWLKSGNYHGGISPLDLINTPEVVEGWGNVYEHAKGLEIYGAYKDKQEADKASSSSRIACIPIKFTKGEGL